MRLPKVTPIGLVEYPTDYRAAGTRSRLFRLMSTVTLIAFIAVGVTTTIVSVGSYCLTSQSTPFPVSSVVDGR